jgi:signal transduction histidine kinase
MRERAARLGGTLHAVPADDGGWTVELDLPRKSAH